MEGEEGAGLRSPRRRRIALALSTCLQVLLLVVLLLAPLLVKGERLQTRWDEPPTPIYIIRGPVPSPDSHPVSGPTKRGPQPPVGTPFYVPTSFPDRAAILHDADEQVPEVGFGGSEFTGAIPIPGSDSSRGWQPPLPEPPPPEPKQKLVVSEGVQAARLIHRVEPVYPALARQTRTQGTVVLHAVIGTDGAVHGGNAHHRHLHPEPVGVKWPGTPRVGSR